MLNLFYFFCDMANPKLASGMECINKWIVPEVILGVQTPIPDRTMSHISPGFNMDLICILDL